MSKELEEIQKYWGEHQERTGESQVSAANKLGMKQAAFSQYMTGSISLNPVFIMKVSKLIGINPKAIRPPMVELFGNLRGSQLRRKIDKTLVALDGKNGK